MDHGRTLGMSSCGLCILLMGFAACSGTVTMQRSAGGGVGGMPGSSTSAGAGGAAATGDGGCGDIVVDPHNCGYCGHDCLGGACEKGACQPIMLAHGGEQPVYVGLDATSLYWIDLGLGRVDKAPIGGGARTELSAAHGAGGMAVDSAYVYWSSSDDGAIERAPISGGAPIELASGVAGAGGVALYAGRIYWTSPGAGTISVVPVAGGAPSVLASGQDQPGAVGVDDANVYWATSSAITRLPLAGGLPMQIAPADKVSGFAVFDGNVYWTEAASGKVRSVPSAGGSPTDVATGQAGPRGVAVDASGVYWTDGATGTIMQATSGGAVKVLAQDQSPWFVALNATAVYWTVDGPAGCGMSSPCADSSACPAGAECYAGECLCGRVMSVAKP